MRIISAHIQFIYKTYKKTDVFISEDVPYYEAFALAICMKSYGKSIFTGHARHFTPDQELKQRTRIVQSCEESWSLIFRELLDKLLAHDPTKSISLLLCILVVHIDNKHQGVISRPILFPVQKRYKCSKTFHNSQKMLKAAKCKQFFCADS